IPDLNFKLAVYQLCDFTEGKPISKCYSVSPMLENIKGTRIAALRTKSRMCRLSWFLDPGGWSKNATVGLYFIFPGICTLSLEKKSYGYQQKLIKIRFEQEKPLDEEK
ncbi:hypothetical protein STEG23_000213, partial [Scotinomys teguina]